MKEREIAGKSRYFFDLNDPIQDASHQKFRHYKHLFLNMTQKIFVFTNKEIQHVTISTDSQYAITVLKGSQKLFFVKIFSMADCFFSEIKIKGR